jgi:hypothetical protein
MAETGFFTVAGQRYQMVIPSVVTLRTVKNALLKLAKTEDADFMLHPEKRVATISSSEAMDWQRRLRAMDECRRVADRYVSYNDCGGRTFTSELGREMQLRKMTNDPLSTSDEPYILVEAPRRGDTSLCIRVIRRWCARRSRSGGR